MKNIMHTSAKSFNDVSGVANPHQAGVVTMASILAPHACGIDIGMLGIRNELLSKINTKTEDISHTAVEDSICILERLPCLERIAKSLAQCYDF